MLTGFFHVKPIKDIVSIIEADINVAYSDVLRTHVFYQRLLLPKLPKEEIIVTYLQERSQIRAYLYDLSFLAVIHCHLLCPRLQNLHHSALHKRPHVSGTVSSSPDYLLGNSGSIFKANGRNGHVSDFRTGTSNACWAIFPF